MTQTLDSNSNSVPAIGAETVTVKVIVLDELGQELLNTSVSLEKGKNGLDASLKATQVDYQTSQYGAFVKALVGYSLPADYFWGLYVDGKFSEIGVDSVKINSDTELI
ncbi:MAG: DUF4430 domain-containing protein, partial [Candidatus Diapherotrites archaeon]|nr:DUF4430 domain-containing protein [Candidatus Diapherotrites archaeon]